MRKYFSLYINNSTTHKTSNIFLTLAHIVIHNGGNNGDIHRSFKANLKAERQAHSTGLSHFTQKIYYVQ